MKSSQKRELKLAESLVRNKTPEQRTKIEESFKAAPSFLRALADRLEAKLEEKIKDSESSKHYLSPNWSEYQADNRGYRRSLREVLNLIVEYK